MTESIVALFGHVDTTVTAIERLRDRGYRDMTVYTPIPVHEIEDVVERDRPVSRVRLFTLIGGLSGTALGFFLTIWTSLKWGLITGGKWMQYSPTGITGASLPPFVIIAFELTILLGGLSTVAAMLVLGRLPKLAPSPTYDPRFTRDKFGVAVHCAPHEIGPVREILAAAGAEEVRP
jgi:molybdopterin-containing oxidoreductase family membrane subunit